MAEISIQTFQGSGFQKGGVFDTSADGNGALDRPRSGFFAGAVYGTVAGSDPSPGGSFVSGGAFSGGGTFGGSSFGGGCTFGGGTFSSR